jgi:hypothetical protein
METTPEGGLGHLNGNSQPTDLRMRRKGHQMAPDNYAREAKGSGRLEASGIVSGLEPGTE